jgi:two-component system cell cycle response regulator
MENAIKLNEPVALLMLDIDFFKAINDTYGHIVGDQILVQITQRWRTQIRASDMLARLGGEEFCLILPKANLAQGELVAKKILNVTNTDLFSISYGKKDHQIKVTTSIGITCSNTSEQTTLEKMIEVADNALFQSKKRGKNCFTSLNLKA